MEVGCVSDGGAELRALGAKVCDGEGEGSCEGGWKGESVGPADEEAEGPKEG